MADLPPKVIIDFDFDNLRISEDTSRHDDDTPVAVLLYTPDMGNTNEHYHIEMTTKQAMRLHSWLGYFLYKHVKP